jgi:hypothetical protein
MAVDTGVGENTGFPHILAGIEVFHTSVLIGVVDHDAWWHL